MDPKHVVSVVLAVAGAAAVALASAEPSLAGACHVVAALCGAVQPYLAMTSSKAGA